MVAAEMTKSGQGTYYGLKAKDKPPPYFSHL